MGVAMELRGEEDFTCKYQQAGVTNNATNQGTIWLTIRTRPAPNRNAVADQLDNFKRYYSPPPISITNINDLGDAALWAWRGDVGGELYVYSGGTVEVQVWIEGLPEQRTYAAARSLAVKALGSGARTGFAYAGAPLLHAAAPPGAPAATTPAPASAPAPGVALAAYARSDNASRSLLMKQAYERALSRTLSWLESTSFKDGKAKTAARVQHDRARAERIEFIVGHFSREQSQALYKLIDDYTRAQPDTELEAVIASFLLTEADKPADGTQESRSYQSFMTQMDRTLWDGAIDASQAELDRKKGWLDCQRRKLDYQVLDDGTRVHREKDGTWHVMAPGAAEPQCVPP
jgi:hypothetical protein